MEQKLLILRLQNISAAEVEVNACLRSERVLAGLKEFGVAAKGLEPCESGRQLEQQREQLPGGEPQQQQPDQPEQQQRVPFRPAPSSTRLPDGSGADPAAILSPAAVLPGQRHEQKPPGASRLAEPVENSGRPCSSFRTDGGAAKSSVRNDMFIATRAPESAKLRRSGMSLRSLGCRWAYAAPTELDRASGAVVAINMSLLTELAGPPWRRRMILPMITLPNMILSCHDSVFPHPKAERQNHGETESWGTKTEPLLARPSTYAIH